jgi:Ca2+-binding RTX toxin-like protein
MGLLQLAGSSPPPPPPPPASTATKLFGTNRPDSIVGTAGDDIICGVPASGTRLGRGNVDTLRGNGGDDLFVLGDTRGVFYDDGRAKRAGTGDYAKIMDFSAGDHVQLKGSAGDYQLKALTIGSTSGIGIYYDTNHDHLWGVQDELIGLVVGTQTLTNADLIFV